MRRLLLGGILGGLVMFAWSIVSWMALSWHDLSIHKFRDEILVAELVREHAPRSGIYLLPNPHLQAPGMTTGETRASLADGIERMRSGPFAFLSVALEGVDPENPALFLRAFAIQLLAALLVTWLLLQTRGLGYLQRVLFVAVIGTLAAILAHLPLWNWWRFPLAYTLVNIADLVIAFVLAGLVIAAVSGKGKT